MVKGEGPGTMAEAIVKWAKKRLSSPETDQSDSEITVSVISRAQETRTHGASLGKELTLISGIGFVVGEVIGSGIFITPQTILEHTGSFGLSLIMWIVGGIVSLLGALSYSELGTLVKKSGAEYAYILEAYSFNRRKPWMEFTGSLLAFLFVWTSAFVIRPASLAIITQAFGKYLSRPFFIDCDGPVYAAKFLALSGLTIVVIINCYSVRLTARVMTVLSFVKLLACGFVIVLGLGWLIANGSFPEDSQKPFAGSTRSPVDVALALYGVFWAYNGWNVVNYAVEEQQNSEKNLPRSLLIGVPIVATTYILVNISFFAVLSYDEIISDEAVALPFGKVILGKAGLVVIPLLVALSTFGAANASLFSGTRAIFVSARDGLLPEMFSGVHSTFKTPMPAVLLQAFLAAVLIMAGDIENLIDGFSAASWIFYGMTFTSLIIMRFTLRKKPRPFKVWIIVPIFMVMVSVFLVVLPVLQKPIPSLTAFGIILLGVPVYIFFVMEKPWRLRPKVIDKISAYSTAFTEALLNTQSSR